MLRPEIEDKLAELLGETNLYRCDPESLNKVRRGLDSTDSPDDTFEMCIDQFQEASLDLEKISDWIMDNFTEKTDGS